MTKGCLLMLVPDPQCGFNRFRKRARCDRFSGARATDQRKDKARHNMSERQVARDELPCSGFKRQQARALN